MAERINITVLLFAFYFSCVPLLSAQNFSISKTNNGTEISEGVDKVLFYQKQAKSQHGRYTRANYVHPLYTLKGNILTEDFPADHPHHHGIFWSWHQIIHNNNPIADGWTSENISWEVVKSKSRKEKGMASLQNEVVWKSVIRNAMEPIVREHSKIVIYAATDQYRLLDFDIRLMALTDSIEIGGSDDAKGYGGFSWRIRLPENVRFLSRDREVTPRVTPVEAGPWLNMVGSFDGVGQPESGIAVFCHPSNPGHPQPWILRKEESMQNVVFPGRTPIALPATGLRLKYRMVIHDGSVDATALEKLYQDYSRL